MENNKNNQSNEIGHPSNGMNLIHKKSISVVIPAYNEEENIKDAIIAIQNYLKPRFQDYEIIVVSEGSKDRTNEIVKELAAQIKNVWLLSNPNNFGFGGALKTGLTSAKKELIFYTDADMQFDINELDKLLPMIERYDIVTGFKIKRNDPLMRSWMSWLYNATMRTLFGLKLKDINCAFKLYKREVIEKIDFLPNLTQGVVNAEVYASALKNGFTIGEVGVNHFARQKGNAGAEIGKRGKIFAFVRPKIMVEFLKDTIKLWRKLH